MPAASEEGSAGDGACSLGSPSDVRCREAELPEVGSISSGSTGSGNLCRHSKAALAGSSPMGAVCAGALGTPSSLARGRAELREGASESEPLAESAGGLAAGSGEAGSAAMQAPDDAEGGSEGGSEGGAAGGAGGPDRQPSPGAPGCQGSSGSREGDGGPGSEGAEGEAAGAPPQAGQAPQALGPGGDAAPVAVAAASRLLELYPFHGASLGRGHGGVAGEHGGSLGKGPKGGWCPGGSRGAQPGGMGRLVPKGLQGVGAVGGRRPEGSRKRLKRRGGGGRERGRPGVEASL